MISQKVNEVQSFLVKEKPELPFILMIIFLKNSVLEQSKKERAIKL